MYFFDRQTGVYGDAANLILIPNHAVDLELIDEGASDSELIDMAMEYERTKAGSALADSYIELINSAAKPLTTYKYVKDGEDPIYVTAKNEVDADDEFKEQWYSLDDWSRETT